MTAQDGWPISWDGIIESVTTTQQPDGAWTVAALGIHPGESTRTARTWGMTRTRRNLERTGEATVQLVTDPVVFTRAALERWSCEEPILSEAAAWIAVEAHRIEEGVEDGTQWVDWGLRPVESDIRKRSVPLPNRAQAAVIEMTIAASRLTVDGYDPEELDDRLRYAADVARRCGGSRERAAVRRIESHLDTEPSGGDGP